MTWVFETFHKYCHQLSLLHPYYVDQFQQFPPKSTILGETNCEKIGTRIVTLWLNLSYLFQFFFNPTFLSKSLFKVLFWVKLFLFWAAHFFGFLFWATQFFEPFFEQITAFEHFFESFFEHFLFRALFWVLFWAPKKELFSLSTFLSTFLRAFFLLFSVRFLPPLGRPRKVAINWSYSEGIVPAKSSWNIYA